MRPWEPEYAGRIEHHTIESKALRDNALGDSAERPLWIYLPPGYDDSARRYPVVYFLQGYAASLPRWGNRPAFGRTVPELVDEVFAAGDTPPCIVVYVDAWTRLGGSQFIDSPATGNYHTYLCEDIVGFVDGNYRTLAAAAHRGLQGHSSGGFGAVVNVMLRPDVFGGFASHAGDSAYELCYPTEIATAYRTLRDRYGGSYEQFFAVLDERRSLSGRADFSVVMTYALSACFSPDADGKVNLPFEETTGRIDTAVWQRWLAWDPVHMVDRYAKALRGARAIWIDAGKSDEYFFDVGAQWLVEGLERIGVRDVAFELFDGGHGGIEHRYPLASRYLANKLS